MIQRRNDLAWRTRNNTPRKQTESLIWKRLNSPFVLWFLSAILLSGSTWFYAQLKNKTEAAAASQLRIILLDQEIAYRLYYGTSVMVNMQSYKLVFDKKGEEKKPVPLGNGKVILKRIFGTPEASMQLHAEFGSRTLESLMRELSTYLRGNQKECVLRAAKDARNLRDRIGEVDRLDLLSSQLGSQILDIARYRWGIDAVYDEPALPKEVRSDCARKT
jgi:hypothetical protein